MDDRSDSLTVTDDAGSVLARHVVSQDLLALVIAWSFQELDRIGELAFVPPEARTPWVFGRGPEQFRRSGAW